MQRGLCERINGWGLRCKLYHGNKNIASRSAKVSARANDNFLFSSQLKERFLKN